MDLIPYRESKLTHLLMPQLGRAGLQGVAMITCVNPQIDDYDETLSILSKQISINMKYNINELIECNIYHSERIDGMQDQGI